MYVSFPGLNPHAHFLIAPYWHIILSRISKARNSRSDCENAPATTSSEGTIHHSSSSSGNSSSTNSSQMRTRMQRFAEFRARLNENKYHTAPLLPPHYTHRQTHVIIICTREPRIPIQFCAHVHTYIYICCTRHLGLVVYILCACVCISIHMNGCIYTRRSNAFCERQFVLNKLQQR